MIQIWSRETKLSFQSNELMIQICHRKINLSSESVTISFQIRTNFPFYLNTVCICRPTNIIVPLTAENCFHGYWLPVKVEWYPILCHDVVWINWFFPREALYLSLLLSSYVQKVRLKLNIGQLIKDGFGWEKFSPNPITSLWNNSCFSYFE